MSFDRLAWHYRWMEAVLAGGLLQRCRTRWLAEVPTASNVLLVGEGHGRMLEACARTMPQARFTVLDQSAAMLDQARRRWRKIGTHQNITFQQTDLRTWRHTGAPFDLIVSNFFLDCFSPEELPRVIANIGAASAPTASWLVSDFIVPAAGWKRLRAQLVLALAYGFFRVATDISARRIVNPEGFLQQQDFQLQRRERFNHELLQADLWQRLAPKPKTQDAVSLGKPT